VFGQRWNYLPLKTTFDKLSSSIPSSEPEFHDHILAIEKVPLQSMS